MSIAKIEEAVKDLFEDFSREDFIYQLLLAYGKPKASITRLQKGNLNLSKLEGEIVWKKNLLFRDIAPYYRTTQTKSVSGVVSEAPPKSPDLHSLIDQLWKSDQVAKHGLRFVVVTDYETLLAVDTKTSETLDIPIKDLPKFFDFFLPWAGHEKHRSHSESQADIKAAYKMAKLYDEICRENQGMDVAARHSLNVFLSRVLFCFFAEDTEIFPKPGMFTNSIASHTEEDGHDLNQHLDKLFEAMNKRDTSMYPAYIQAFPYVNGGLFADKITAPKFSRQARKILIECGELNWSEINPDIFGSMIQAVVHPDERNETGMHYTSVSNIMKVIEPLFLDELNEQFEEQQDNIKGLQKLLDRIYRMRIFDPACGSGNFLIIAYKELRLLEMRIYHRLREISQSKGFLYIPQIRLTQFYGIELDDFAHEIAILSMWLAEHQMNVKFKQEFGQVPPPLPLKESGHIVCGNATRLEWETICPKEEDGNEVFLLGNPPYLGARNQSPEQKRDVEIALGDLKGANNLDYIACWFFKAADYLAGARAKSAFVSTNSICQGEQVSLLWPYVLFEKQLEIDFAHRSFRWENNAKHNAGVTVAIIGLRNKSNAKKYLFDGNGVRTVENIGPYLIEGKNIVVYKTNEVFSGLPPMCFGSMPNDGGKLFLSPEEVQKLSAEYPQAEKFVKRMFGAEEFINGDEEYCLWIYDRDKEIAEKIPPIAERINAVRKQRLASNRAATQKLADVPYRFGEVRHKETNAIIVPCHTSERRNYIPFGFLDKESVILNSAQAIYDPEPWVFGVICSRLHNVWVRAVAGRIRTDIRYSSSLCYNPFPIPILSEKQKEMISTHVFNVLAERENHPEKTIAQLYDPDLMPPGLSQAHQDLDTAVEKCYRSRPFGSDEQRLEYLFELYEETRQNVLRRGNNA